MLRQLSILLLAVFTLTTALPAEAAADPASRREAAAWVKESMNKRKKALGLLKKVKDAKTAKRIGKALQKEFATSEGKQTAMGEVAPPQAPEGEAMDAEMEKKSDQIAMLVESIAKQRERIDALELDSTDLKAGIDAMDAALAQ